MSTENCTHVTPECPIEAELYGYAPNLAANLFFAIFFGICAVIHLVAGIRYRTWFYGVVLICGCLYECVGYIGRVIMHFNVWNNAGFQMNIGELIAGPAYLSAGIYVTLKHIVLNIDQRHSRVKAAWYTWIFISGDAVALGIQTAGGALAAAAKTGSNLLNVGTNVMIAGIIFQIVDLIVFGYLLIEYFARVFRHRSGLSREALDILQSSRFRCFMAAIIIAYLGIFIRSVYRLPELLRGWGNPLMREELPFIVLEGVMITVSTLALTAFHPGWFFPAMCSTGTSSTISPSTQPAGWHFRGIRSNKNLRKVPAGDVYSLHAAEAPERMR